MGKPAESILVGRQHVAGGELIVQRLRTVVADLRAAGYARQVELAEQTLRTSEDALKEMRNHLAVEEAHHG